MLEEIRQMIGLIDAAAVAVATAITLNLSVEETAQLANAASECILVADRTDRFVLRLDDMIDRIGKIVWSLQVSNDEVTYVSAWRQQLLTKFAFFCNFLVSIV